MDIPIKDFNTMQSMRSWKIDKAGTYDKGVAREKLCPYYNRQLLKILHRHPDRRQIRCKTTWDRDRERDSYQITATQPRILRTFSDRGEEASICLEYEIPIISWGCTSNPSHNNWTSALHTVSRINKNRGYYPEKGKQPRKPRNDKGLCRRFESSKSQSGSLVTLCRAKDLRWLQQFLLEFLPTPRPSIQTTRLH